jgi:hypothetical protein
MRHKIILFITATLLVTSCDNSSDYLSVNEKETESLKIDTASYYKILESNAIEYRNYKRSSVNPILTRAIATNEGNDIVVYSYTNKSSTGYKTYALDKNLKSILGLYPYAYYICEFITATYELTIPGISNRTVRFSDVESPKCGLFPDYTKDEYNKNINYLFYELGMKNQIKKVQEIFLSFEDLKNYLKDDNDKKFNIKENIYNILDGAIYSGKIEMVDYLLTAKNLPNKIKLNIDHNDGHALSMASFHGHLELVDYLLTSPKLKQHANINIGNDKPIYYATDFEFHYAPGNHQNNEIIKYLLTSPKLKQHANPNVMYHLPFQEACRHANIEIMDMLWNLKKFDRNLSLYALNANGQSTFELACNNTHQSLEPIIYLINVCKIKSDKNIKKFIKNNEDNEAVMYYVDYLEKNSYDNLTTELKNDKVNTARVKKI